jgi:hypothetical protein
MTLTQVIDGKTTRKDYEVQRLANQHFRKLYADASRTDLDAEWSAFGEKFGTTKPEMFCHSTRRETRKAYDALRGSVGKLRVIIGQPLERRCIDLSEIGLEDFEYDIFVQFEPELNRMVFDSLQKALGDAPFFAVLERGRLSGRNHLHLLLAPGTCLLGAFGGIVKDTDLVEWLIYLMKPPLLNLENFTGYISVKQASPGRLAAGRICSRGLPNSRTRLITIQDIEVATGLSLTKPQATKHVQKESTTTRQTLEFETSHVGGKTGLPDSSTFQTSHVGGNDFSVFQTSDVRVWSPNIPRLKEADPKTEVLIHNLKAVWLTGFFNNSPGRIGAGKCKDLGFSLGTYFKRSWLSAGEVYDLAQLALSLGIEEPYVPFDIPETYQQVAA